MKTYILTLLFLLAWLVPFAGVEVYSERIAPSGLSTGSTIDLFDQQFVDMNNNSLWGDDFYNKRVTNKVRIGYVPDHFPVADVDHAVELKIDCWRWVGTAFIHTVVTKTLHIKFRADGHMLMDDLSTYVFADAHRVKVTVMSITGANAGNVFVETEMEIERYYKMSNAAPSNAGHRHTDVSNDYLEFYWTPVKEAESYELEWTFVSDYDYNIAAQAIAHVPPSDLSFDFYKNSTRVDVKESYYRIPAIFNHGYVIYRVRAIGRQGSTYQYRKESAWTLAESGGIGALTSGLVTIDADYEAGKNWQHQVSYTEGGKRFESISFADGFGRGRQSVSHNTETAQAVVSNVYYDRIGRPVVSDLPTAVDGEKLRHTPNFNYGVDLYNGNAEAAYGLIHYDYEQPGGECQPATNPFSQDHGAGKYYSSSNPNREGANATIPDANGYPFAQVEYMNDQTGRIRRTGAYGVDHQLNGHSTHYFYDIPLQPELNMLFGTEVGINSHYQRTITIDANGQAYASYYDLAGRVIASCLIGEAPDNLEALENNAGPVVAEKEIYAGTSKQVLDTELGIVSYSYPYTVVSASEYTIHHSFEPSQFTDSCLPEGFCYDCFYDLTIEVTDPVCPDPEPIYSHTETINGWAVDNMCNGTSYDGTEAIIHLDQGQYYIHKVLRVSEGAAEAYWCNYVSSSTCTPDYSSIYTAAYDSTDFGCTATQSLGDMNTCDKYRRILAADLALGGQYGEIYVADLLNPSAYGLSIYNLGNTLPNGGDWRTPDGHYLDEDSNEVHIYISGSTGNYTPAVYNETGILTDANGDLYIYPENLANFSDYMHYWRMSWAYALVKYHPEYCYLQFCDENVDFHLYDQALEATDSYDAACAAGFFDPILEGVYPDPNPMHYFQGCPNTSNPDSFFTGSAWDEIEGATSPAASYDITLLKDTMDVFFLYQNRNNQKLSLWEYAVWQVHCQDTNFTYAQLKDCIKEAELTECEKDQVWQIFRGEYQNLRHEYYLIAQTMYVSYPSILPGGSCGPAFNGCIGDSSYDFSTLTLKYGFKPYEYLSTTGAPTAIANTTGPCATTTADSYEDKVSRFDNLPPLGGTPLPPGLTLDPAGIQSHIDDLVEANCSTQCGSYADEWMEKLAGCNMTTAQEVSVRAGLIEVCMGGCSAENPAGATTAAPGSGLTNETFGEVLAATLGSSYPSAVCSEYLISTPRPYGSNDIELAQAVKLEPCGCDKLLQAELDFNTMSPLPAGVNSVEEMLAWKEGIEVTDSKALICACNKAFVGTWAPGATWNTASINNLVAAAVPVPAAFSCSSCAPCEKVQDLVEDFLALFEAETDFTSHENYEDLFTNYLNNHLGYHLILDEYETFLEGCSATSEAPLCTTTGLGRLFKDLLDVIARQGKLVTPSSAPYALSGNIVYQYSNISSLLEGSGYWADVASGTLTMHFGGGSGEKNIIFHLPAGADFGFSDIVGVSDITAINGCGEDNIDLAVRVVICGEIVTRHLIGQSGDLELVKCYCEGNLGQLCDELPYAAASPCYAHELMVLNSVTEEAFRQQVANQHEAFVADYIQQCSTGFKTDRLSITGPDQYYQYTLFYYDQAGNLVKTVAPKGALDAAFISGDLATVDQDRQDETSNVPAQTYETRYKYNSYNQVVETTNPDQEGATSFWHDRYGRIIASQNPQQALDGIYSYTLYDVQGRAVESGQVNSPSPASAAILSADDLGSSFKAWVYAGTRTEVNVTQYDAPLSVAVDGLFAAGQQNLRLRVASVLYFDAVTGLTDLTTDYNSAIHYSYDEHGNVMETLQDVPLMAVVGQGVKSTKYDFELVSGNVQKVRYQEGERDEMTHRYKYDLLNRLTDAYTSTDGVHESREARYRYHDYGPLARTEIGQHQVQGMDHAYTVNGWIKGMNSNTLKASRDMGRDGIAGYNSQNSSMHQGFAGDVAGYTIGYFSGDYEGIGNVSFEASLNTAPANAFKNAQVDLYNGNIAHLVTAIKGFDVQGTAYRYDQQQRLKEMRVFRAANVAKDNNWLGAAETNEYKNSYGYDENGNILSLVRNGNTANGLYMDNLAYIYVGLDGLPVASSASKSNRLDHVSDTGADDATNTGDVKNMSPNNYGYDRIGQLTRDNVEGIQEIQWFRGSKKLKKIVRNSLTNASSPEMEFIYNPFGQRIVKIVKPRSGGVLSSSADWTYTYYAYDANGQVMAVYTSQVNSTDKDVKLSEQHIYGAGRIGVVNTEKLIYSATATVTDPAEIWTNAIGNKRYEITNYLGNVNAVITDRKVPALQTATITDQVGISISGGVITKTGTTAWGTGGGASVESVNQGGAVEWTLGGTIALDNRLVFVGLSYTNPNANYTSIGYSWYTHSSGNTYIYESGTQVGSALDVYNVGDVLRIERNLDSIIYYHNGVKKRSLLDPNPASAMVADFAIYTNGSKIYKLAVQESVKHEAVVVMKGDYYPFGMQMPGRSEDAGGYRYGYNGMEKDDAIKGEGNSYTTEFRQYDPRLGRWLSLDPFKSIYPSMSPYSYAGNSPIAAFDPNGKWIIFINGFTGGPVGPAVGLNSPSGAMYWSDDLKSTEYIESAMIYFKDKGTPQFLDGSDGYFGESTAAQRFVKGYAQGITDAKSIIERLEDSGEEEMIEILTHSMGAAYGEGYVAGLIKAGVPAGRIKKIVHLSAADAADIPIAKKARSIKRVQLGIDRDWTLFDLKRGADRLSFGKRRMIQDVDVYGEINADENMLDLDWQPDAEKRHQYHADKDYHAYTKWNPDVFDALRELENPIFNDTQDSGGRNYYHISLGSGKFKWNALKLGNGEYIENVKDSADSNIFVGGHK